MITIYYNVIVRLINYDVYRGGFWFINGVLRLIFYCNRVIFCRGRLVTKHLPSSIHLGAIIVQEDLLIVNKHFRMIHLTTSLELDSMLILLMVFVLMFWPLVHELVLTPSSFFNVVAHAHCQFSSFQPQTLVYDDSTHSPNILTVYPS